MKADRHTPNAAVQASVNGSGPPRKGQASGKLAVHSTTSQVVDQQMQKNRIARQNTDDSGSC